MFYSKFLTLFVIIFAVGVFLYPSNTASAASPFGGFIVSIDSACINGKWIIVGPPVGGSFMYTPGTISYAFGPPSHVGQWLLGMFGPQIPCLKLMPRPPYIYIAGFGNLIIFHGSSM